MAVLLVEQNALMALNVASRGYVLEVGSIVLQDEARALQRNERVQKAYLGGFEQIAYAVSTTPADKIHDLTARIGCEILGPPVV